MSVDLGMKDGQDPQPTTDLARIDPAVPRQLAEMRASRPARRSVIAATFMTFMAGTAAVSAAIAGIASTSRSSTSTVIISLVVAIVTGLISYGYWSQGGRWGGWLKQFRGKRTKGRAEGTVQRLPSGLTLQYRVVMEADIERVVLTPFPPTMVMRPGLPPILDPEFDHGMGLRATPVELALLGPSLRAHAAKWFTHGQLVVDDGEGRMRLGKEGFDDQGPEFATALAALSGYGARLLAPAKAALVAMASDPSHPFDAARALATLHVLHPQAAEVAVAALNTTKAGQALARIATLGEGLLDPALDWPARSAAVRGVLGVDGAAQTQLLGTVTTLSPTDAASAMAIVDMLEAAHRIARDAAFFHRAEAALAGLVEQADPVSLGWLQARARRNKRERRRLVRVAARIQEAHGGQLALDLSDFEGSLSDALAGEVTIADEDGA